MSVDNSCDVYVMHMAEYYTTKMSLCASQNFLHLLLSPLIQLPTAGHQVSLAAVAHICEQHLTFKLPPSPQIQQNNLH